MKNPQSCWCYAEPKGGHKVENSIIFFFTAVCALWEREQTKMFEMGRCVIAINFEPNSKHRKQLMGKQWVDFFSLLGWLVGFICSLNRIELERISKRVLYVGWLFFKNIICIRAFKAFGRAFEKILKKVQNSSFFKKLFSKLWKFKRVLKNSQKY